MALLSDVRVPRICLSPTPGKSSGTASGFRLDVVDRIPHPYPFKHGRRSNDVSPLALSVLCDRHLPHSSPSQLSRSICTHGRRVGLSRLGWLPAGQHVCALRVQRVVLCGHVSSRFASCCKATRYNYIDQRSQPNSFQRGGRHSVHAETFPRAAISGRCWMPLQICTGQARARVSPGRARARRRSHTTCTLHK